MLPPGPVVPGPNVVLPRFITTGPHLPDIPDVICLFGLRICVLRVEEKTGERADVST